MRNNRQTWTCCVGDSIISASFDFHGWFTFDSISDTQIKMPHHTFFLRFNSPSSSKQREGKIIIFSSAVICYAAVPWECLVSRWVAHRPTDGSTLDWLTEVVCIKNSLECFFRFAFASWLSVLSPSNSRVGVVARCEWVCELSPQHEMNALFSLYLLLPFLHSFACAGKKEKCSPGAVKQM